MDVYSDWIDACDAVTRESGGVGGDDYAGESYRRKDSTEGGGGGSGGVGGVGLGRRQVMEDDEELDEDDY